MICPSDFVLKVLRSWLDCVLSPLFHLSDLTFIFVLKAIYWFLPTSCYYRLSSLVISTSCVSAGSVLTTSGTKGTLVMCPNLK